MKFTDLLKTEQDSIIIQNIIYSELYLKAKPLLDRLIAVRQQEASDHILFPDQKPVREVYKEMSAEGHFEGKTDREMSAMHRMSESNPFYAYENFTRELARHGMVMMGDTNRERISKIASKTAWLPNRYKGHRIIEKLDDLLTEYRDHELVQNHLVLHVDAFIFCHPEKAEHIAHYLALHPEFISHPCIEGQIIRRNKGKKWGNRFYRERERLVAMDLGPYSLLPSSEELSKKNPKLYAELHCMTEGEGYPLYHSEELIEARKALIKETRAETEAYQKRNRVKQRAESIAKVSKEAGAEEDTPKGKWSFKKLFGFN
ncbi:hypothetical protein [Neptuniibacter sp. QD37_11]|uniref:hypothetical protein n=1 Tax=Neptuniibacter sp. QD37_11 TaxID=3398209 RepID=UPI0039F5E8FA